MDRQAASQLAPYLARDETLIWAGRPDRLRYAAARMGPTAALAAAFLTGLAGVAVLARLGWLPWMPGGAGGIAVVLFLLPIVYLSLRILVLPIERYREASHVTYGLTGRRVIRLTAGRRSSIEEIPIDRLRAFARRAHSGARSTVEFALHRAGDVSRRDASPRRHFALHGIADGDGLARHLEALGVPASADG